MAIVDLGTQPLSTGLTPVGYTAFTYDQTLAYGIGCIFSSANFNTIFSFVRIRAVINVPGQPAFTVADFYDLEILNFIQLILFPCSPLFRGNGTVQFFAERLPKWKGAGDGTSVSLQLLYDDAITTPSWRA